MTQGSRSRSRSPQRNDHSSRHRHHRSRSPHRSRHHHHGRSSRNADKSTPTLVLPMNAKPLSKHDLSRYRPMFALYLDIQKQKDIDDMTEDEIKGRWKSFFGKWNRKELAEGWYDPKILDKAIAAEAEHTQEDRQDVYTREPRIARTRQKGRNNDDEEDDDEYGPSLPQDHPIPSDVNVATQQRPGPSIPSIDDLRARNEQLTEETEAQYEQRLHELRNTRRLNLQAQKDRLDDLAPRAEPGTRDRQLERKREIADSNRAFAAAKDASGDVELPDQDVLGDEDSLGRLKSMQKEAERKKNDREIRREEVLRARTAEREERMRGMREKEEKTMAGLREIARRRFGGVD